MKNNGGKYLKTPSLQDFLLSQEPWGYRYLYHKEV